MDAGDMVIELEGGEQVNPMQTEGIEQNIEDENE